MSKKWTNGDAAPKSKGLAVRHDVDSKKSVAKKGERKWDGWGNLLTGMGKTSTDRKLSTKFEQSNGYLQENELLAIYGEDGLGRRVVDVVVDDMVREWMFVTGDTDNAVNAYLKKINGKPQITKGLRWGSLHGGCLAVLGINDGGTYEIPVQNAKIKSVEHIHTFDRWRVQVSPSDTYTDPTDKRFGKPRLYTIQPMDGVEFKVHESRTLSFEGPDTPDMSRRENNNWNYSDLQHVYDRLRGIGESVNGIEHIISEFIVGVLTINNLQELIASGQEALVQKRLNLIDLTKHIMNTMILDSKEQFTRVTSSVAGLAELFDKLAQLISASTSIPIVVLMGESPKGMDATGESDIRRYYDMVGFRQENRLAPQLEKLVRYVFLAKDGPTKGVEPEVWAIKFPPLWKQTAKEIADVRKTVAETDMIYVEMGATSAEEVSLSRWGGEEYSSEMKLSAERPEPKEPEEPEERETETSPGSED